ncbi:MAG: diguanylate cyclase [Solirubrobacteraceae bacterium]|nr:diguanylate cyclase [Solirubrobacteraceae bacterium]
MGLIKNQRATFALLTLASTGVAWWLVSAKVGDGWIVVYAALLPIGYRLLILASDRADLARLWRSVQVWRAMRRDEIVLHYQPKVAVADGAPAGVEALARWEHPRRGLLPPADWLDATNHRWLEGRFFAYVLRRAVRQAAAWREAGWDLVVCVNASPSCFISAGVPHLVADMLAEYRLPPTYLCLELTEIALDISTAADEVAEELTAMGIVLALDDFGVGHSSMDRLVGLPIGELKIDKRFVTPMVTSPSNGAVVRASVGLGHNLGMVVVAEGVETQDSLRSLRNAGCDIAQGFLFSRALPARELEEWMVGAHGALGLGAVG